MGVVYHVTIVHATGVGGVYPFAVACFDGDIAHELFKTPATTGGEVAAWNHEQVIDLKAEMSAREAAGLPEPTYLTIFLFDTGAQGVPSLGSAGVLLSTVREKGVAQGDFPIVNGTGTLNAVVRLDKMKNFLQAQAGEDEEGYSSAAKIAGVVGVGALAAGLAGVGLHQYRKKKKPPGVGREEGEDEEEEEGEEGEEREEHEERAARSGIFSKWWNSSSSSDEENGQGEPAPANEHAGEEAAAVADQGAEDAPAADE